MRDGPQPVEPEAAVWELIRAGNGSPDDRSQSHVFECRERPKQACKDFRVRLALNGVSCYPHTFLRPKTDTLATFSILAEILASKTLPTSIDLVVRLIESLNNVLQIAPTAQSDLSYVQQLLMLSIENVADKITVRMVKPSCMFSTLHPS